MRRRNRKLLVSVFNAQESREGVLGGARIVDAEDPRSALGNIAPRHIMDISDAVLAFRRDLEVQISTNIGEDQLLFDRSETGHAIQKSPYEIAGKASQAAIGVALAMGSAVSETNFVKVGVDGMQVDLLKEVISEVSLTLERSERLRHCQVMTVLFAQDIDKWNERKTRHDVRRVLVGLREYYPSEDGDQSEFDLLESDVLVGTVRDERGHVLFTKPSEVPSGPGALRELKEFGVLPKHARSTTVRLNELFAHEIYFKGIKTSHRTTREVIKAMVDASVEAGAHAMMLDTRIQSKVARISLVDTSSGGMINTNSLDVRGDLARTGVLPIEDIDFFVEYSHYKGIVANLAGSFQSHQAQQVWLLSHNVDQISTRGGSTAVAGDPYGGDSGTDTRQFRVTNRNLVRGLVPPEQEGQLNVPSAWEQDPNKRKMVFALIDMLDDHRRRQGFDPVRAYWVGKTGIINPIKR